MPGSPAAEAGLRKNDIVTGVDHIPVEGWQQFRARIASARLGEPLPITVWRQGTEEDPTLHPISLEQFHQRQHAQGGDKPLIFNRWGFALATENKNVVVLTVHQQGKAYQAGLRATVFSAATSLVPFANLTTLKPSQKHRA